jgi:hypothetical protein
VTGPTAEGIASLLPYFNAIMGAVEQGATTADLWNAYRNAVSLAGGVLGNPSIQDMNFVSGSARAILRAESSLAAANPGDAITGDHWAFAPWAAQQTDSWLGEHYQIRYEAQLVGPNGEQVPIWGVTDYEGSLEGLTKADIYGRAETSAQYSLDSYGPQILQAKGIGEGFSVAGINRVQIMRI